MPFRIVPGRQPSPLRRILGDGVLETLLQALTLGLGWMIWLSRTAPAGQTPAKKLLQVRVHHLSTGRVASARRVWLREVVAKQAVPAALLLLGLWLSSVSLLLAACLYIALGVAVAMANGDRRALWDYVAGTVVRHHPGGLRLLTLDARPKPDPARVEHPLRELETAREYGLITDAEYEQKRQDILDGFGL